MSILTESDPRSYAIIGAAMEVHRQLGCGFLEQVYQEALGIELANRSIPFRPQQEFRVSYKGRELEAHYKPDFICFEEVTRLYLFRRSGCGTQSSWPIKFGRRVTGN